MSPAQHSAALEALRRERFSTHITSETIAGIDYASAGLKIQVACDHLDESLPNRQVLRTRRAYAALVEGTAELGLWLRSNGYDTV